MKAPKFRHDDFDIINRQTEFKGFFELQALTIKHKLFQGGNSPEFTRELFVRGSVVVVLLYDPPADKVVLVEQFRVGALEDERSPWLLELVAGIVDSGETPEQVARRESFEESGCTIQELEPIYTYWVSPGANNERVHLYCGYIDSKGIGGGVHGLEYENEDIRVHLLSRADAWQAVESGIVNNAATILGLQWLELNKVRIQQQRCL